MSIDFSDSKNGSILNAYLHNNNECITIVHQGSLALTFEKRAFEKDKMTLKYYIDSQICRGVQVGDDLYIESEIKSLEELDNSNDLCHMQLILYKVSSSEKEDLP